MYLTELIVRAFGLHIEKKIKFTQGLNIIVGESEKGKTTLIRALRLLIENQPRGGEKLYQSWLTDKKLMIQLTNNHGHTVKRSKNKYYLNGGDPLKAFGAGVPEPIRELFNFKEINWQRQHDVHYLLFSTGGSAGKLLNNATGMGNQELIIAEIKSELSNSKGEVKRLKKNNIEHLQTVERLKNITRFRLKAEGIIHMIEDSIELKKKSDRLENILVQLEFINEDKKQFRKAKPHMDTINQILEDYKEIDVFKNHIKKLVELLGKIERTETYDQDLLIGYLKSLQTLHSLNSEYIMLTSKTKLLEKYISEIEQAKEERIQLLEEMKKAEAEIEQTFEDLGYCPLCNREIKDGDTCCR